MKIFLFPLAIILAGCQAEPRVVTRTVTVEHSSYVPLDPSLLPSIDAPANTSSVITNGQMWDAWQHDAGQLGICKPALDGIRALQPKPGSPVPGPRSPPVAINNARKD